MKRHTAHLSESLQQRLNAYALAASAAGVSLLALAQSGEAKIVYTPAHVRIGHGGVHGYNIDFNHDGIADAIVGTTYGCDLVCAYQLGGQGQMEGMGVSARALRAGARIGSSRNFVMGWALMAGIYISYYGKRRVRGYWPNVKNRYLGLWFQADQETHYAWARLNVKMHKRSVTATLTGYAYETIPNKPIIAGKTHGKDDAQHATLGALAAGSSSIPTWRAKEHK